ncbi:MAG: serine dehydratase subunit alpha family protein, partial [Deltaproteobacteria bacterium]|nr:serine dehydratase subunit alpha family protein [Deltaproteobacteria bacterium]
AAHLSCDPRIFKNCHAVGIPHSGGRTGILWALAIGASLPDATGQLECFRRVDGAVLTRAEGLLRAGAVTVEVDPSPRSLLVDCRVVSSEGVGRARIEDEHTRVVRLERDGVPADVGPDQGGPVPPPLAAALREDLAGRTFEELVSLARSLEPGDAALLRRGVAMNLTIAQHGLSLFPRRFFQTMGSDGLSRLSRLVCAGVYARMSGADDTVMSLAGSGNKGITASVPLALWGEDNGHPPERVEEALALACLVTSATTHRLGTLSAVCGCSNAAGIGLAAGLVHLEGGSPAQLALAMNNMVGNVTGMICDGAKIGCALKTMTSVDAAFRAASLALSGMGIPETDGIVGRDGEESLRNLGRIATHGMVATDGEILRILQDKLRAHPST